MGWNFGEVFGEFWKVGGFWGIELDKFAGVVCRLT